MIFRKAGSIDELNAVTAEFKKIHGPVTGNMYLFPADLQRYIELGRLLFYTDDNSIYVLSDEEKYYQLYVTCRADGKPAEAPAETAGEAAQRTAHNEGPFGGNIFEDLGKPVVARIIYRREDDKNYLAVKEFLGSLGFCTRDVTVEMRMNLAAEKEQLIRNYELSKAFVKRRGFEEITADISYKPAIDRLREASLDPLHFRFETDEEEKAEYERGHFRCIIGKDGEVAATHRFEVFGSHATGHVIAAEEKYRRLGIAPLLVYGFLAELAKKGEVQNCNCFVVSDNEPSLGMHTRIGFRLTGKKSEQMVCNACFEK